MVQDYIKGLKNATDVRSGALRVKEAILDLVGSDTVFENVVKDNFPDITLKRVDNRMQTKLGLLVSFDQDQKNKCERFAGFMQETWGIKVPSIGHLENCTVDDIQKRLANIFKILRGNSLVYIYVAGNW